MKEFVEKLIGRLEEYKYSHLVECDSESVKHCVENEKHCEGNDCILCVWDKSKEIVKQLAEEYGKDTNVTTNADRIRSMSNEELAEFLCKITMHHPDYCPAYNNCMRKSKGGMKDWLQSEVKGSDV